MTHCNAVGGRGFFVPAIAAVVSLSFACATLASAADAPAKPAAKPAAAAPAAKPAAAAPAAAGGAMPTNIWEGVYTSAQAKRGDALYSQQCAMCHMPDMGGKEPAPELAGDNFMSKWYGHTVGELFTRVSTSMPAGNPGSLTKANYLDLVALLLQANNFKSGKIDLQNNQPALDQIKIAPKK